MRVLIGMVVRGGILLAAFLVLTPTVWSREDLGVLPAIAAVSIGQGIGGDRRPHVGSFRRWIVRVVLVELSYVAVVVVLLTSLGLAFGQDLLSTPPQRLVAGGAVVILVVLLVTMRVLGSRREEAREADREARRQAIREDVRREIAEIERRARES